MLLEHPVVSGLGSALFHWRYLWVYPMHYAIALHGNLAKRDTWRLFDVAAGQYRFPFFDRWKAGDPARYIRARVQLKPGDRNYAPSQALMDYLKKIHALARQNGIDVTMRCSDTSHFIPLMGELAMMHISDSESPALAAYPAFGRMYGVAASNRARPVRG